MCCIHDWQFIKQHYIVVAAEHASSFAIEASFSVWVKAGVPLPEEVLDSGERLQSWALVLFAATAESFA